MSDDYVWIDARFPGKCHECGENIEEMDRILWEPSRPSHPSRVYCKECGKDIGEPDLGPGQGEFKW